MIVIGIKCYLMGVFSALMDLIALIFLLLAVIRYDYCLLMCYIVLNLFETFSLIVVLGYYLQTDMGKNVPRAGDKQQGPEKKPEQKPAASNEEEEHFAKTKVNGFAHIMFRGIFDQYLKLKYNFYQNPDYSVAQKVVKKAT